MNLTQDYMTKDFQLLAGTLNLTEALVELVTDKYGVVLDEHSKPVALVIADDLKQAPNQGTSSLLDIKVGFLPIITVGCQVDMRDLVKWEGFIERYEKIRGVIVIDENGVVGILAVTTVRKYLKNRRDNELRGDGSGALGGSELPGKLQSPKALIKCGECGFVNKLSFLDDRKLPYCQNPNKAHHKFKLT